MPDSGRAPVAVVARMPGGGGAYGVALLHEEGAAMVLLTLGVAEWRRLLPQIEAACDLAETPGELPVRRKARG